jgi:uncharacterized protein YjiS (DUF1127 family)
MHTLTKVVHLGLPDIANWFKEIRKTMELNRAARITIKELSNLSDRELNDMGICRGEIYNIAHSSVWKTETNPNLRGW